MGEARKTWMAAVVRPWLPSRFTADTRGVAAVEFAMVMPPFLVLVLGVLTIGLQFFTMIVLDTSVETASRQLRTGTAQAAGLTVGDFKTLVCNSAGGVIACNTNLSILITSGATFADLGGGPACLTGSSLTPSPPPDTSLASLTGSQGKAVMVTVCYSWSLGTSLWSKLKNFISVAPLQNGQSILSSRAMFRLES